jgi:hypothetical protein
MATRIVQHSLIAFAALILAVLTGCGGGQPSGSNPQPPVTGFQFVFSPTPVFNLVRDKQPQVAARDWSLIPSVHAQNPVTVTNVGNYSGFCATVPAGATTTLYGVGRWSDSDCLTNFASFSNDGAPVIGAGTIGNLIVLGTGGLDATDGVVQILVNNTVTPITATLGTSRKATDATHTFAVNDGDSIVATITTKSGTALQNVRVLLGKQ